jgi:hypothetical protein
MKIYNVDFVYKTYHWATILADSPDDALKTVANLTYGVEPDWKPDKEFLKDTQYDDYEGVSVEATVNCQFVWWVKKWDLGKADEDPYLECYDSYEEAEAAIGDDENCQTVEQTIEFDKTEYQMPCKFLEAGGIMVELKEEYILAILPLLKHAIEGGQDSVSARVAYNRLLSALEGKDYKGYDPSRELDFYKVEQS